MKIEIISLPHPALRQASQEVKAVDDQTKALVKKLVDQAKLWESGRPHEKTVGLAGVQINQLFKVAIIRAGLNGPSKFHALINPEIIESSGPTRTAYEGCLSVPQFYAKVGRCNKIRVRALDLKGQPFELVAHDFTARILQHEIDHLQGITIVDRAQSFARLTKSGQLKPVSCQEIIRRNWL